MSSNVSAGAQGGSLLPDASSSEPAYHHTSGSSRASGLSNGTTRRCNSNAASPSTTSPSILPTVLPQTSMGEERDAGMGEASTRQRQPRCAAQKQRELLKQLLQQDQL